MASLVSWSTVVTHQPHVYVYNICVSYRKKPIPVPDNRQWCSLIACTGVWQLLKLAVKFDKECIILLFYTTLLNRFNEQFSKVGLTQPHDIVMNYNLCSSSSESTFTSGFWVTRSVPFNARSNFCSVEVSSVWLSFPDFSFCLSCEGWARCSIYNCRLIAIYRTVPVTLKLVLQYNYADKSTYMATLVKELCNLYWWIGITRVHKNGWLEWEHVTT